MSVPARRTGAALLALLATAGIVALSRAPYSAGEGDIALLRLSWSGRPERIERCRELSDAELAERPAHMRRRLECEGRSARYAVGVRSDGLPLSVDTVTGGGLRGDRAIHMLREYRLPPGEHTIAVEIARIDSVGAVEEVPGEGAGTREEAERPRAAPLDRSRRERDERMRQLQEALPPRLRLDTVLALRAGGVVLITYDPSARRLLALTGARR